MSTYNCVNKLFHTCHIFYFVAPHADLSHTLYCCWSTPIVVTWCFHVALHSVSTVQSFNHLTTSAPSNFNLLPWSSFVAMAKPDFIETAAK